MHECSYTLQLKLLPVCTLECGHVLESQEYKPQLFCCNDTKPPQGTFSMQTQRSALEAAIERAQRGLQEGKERFRHLHSQCQTLKHRISASEQSMLPSTPAPTPTRTTNQATILAASAIPPEPLHGKGNDKPPARARQDSDPSKQQKVTLNHQMVQCSGHSRYNQHCIAPSLKPISAFKHQAVISFSSLNKYMTIQECRSSSQFNGQQMRQAILMCQTETAQRLNVPASEICWFVEWPYEACAQKRLCTSFSAWSGGCKLASLVARMAMTLECTFLVLEHELLSGAADPLFKPPKHPVLKATEPPLPPRLQLPKATVLAAAHVRCGVKDIVQLEVAMRRIVLPLVRRFRSLLPWDKWLAPCIQIMRVAQIAIAALRSIPNQKPETSPTHQIGVITEQVDESFSEV
jgi:hypothetical protein